MNGDSLAYQVGDFEALNTLNSVVATVACGRKWDVLNNYYICAVSSLQITTQSTIVSVGYRPKNEKIKVNVQLTPKLNVLY